MLNYRKTMLAASLLALIGVWMGCSSDTSPVASYSASKSHTAAQDDAETSQHVGIPDPELDKAIRIALGVSITALNFGHTEATMASLTRLDAGGRGISDLAGLEHATGLTYLNLGGNSIADISDLAGLTGLDTLNLGGNRITNVDSLARLTKLKLLNLKFNRITNVDSLARLTNLEHLRLYTNGITDITPLEKLKKLTVLSVGANEFGGDLSGLAENLTELEWLKVNAADVTDLSPLENLKKLKYLNLSSNGGITDTGYSPLKCLLPTLERLDLRGMHDNPRFTTQNGLKRVADGWPTLKFLEANLTIHWD